MIQDSKEWLDKNFPIVEASKLSLDDEFMSHEPKTGRQACLKKSLTDYIKAGWLKDFRRPAIDPSFKDDKIVYEAGLMPATRKSYNWWRKNAKGFMPEMNSRLGTVIEYDAFFGVLIKYLINEMGYTVSQAWKAVCDDSKELGHYWNSENAKHNFEATGSRRIGLFYDLANTCKILSNYNGTGFWLAGGSYGSNGSDFPLNHLDVERYPDSSCNVGVGWLVLDV